LQPDAGRRSARLVLTRKPGAKLVIGDGITVLVVEVAGNQVRGGLVC
jgi:sRNA-binding carbon storage regulator CsrA